MQIGKLLSRKKQFKDSYMEYKPQKTIKKRIYQENFLKNVIKFWMLVPISE